MNDFIIDLYQSFLTVAPEYYSAEVYRDLDNYHQDQETQIQSTENTFTAEVYSYWRNIMMQYPQRYENLTLGFDLRKDWFGDDIFERVLNSYRPDLILHASQTNWDPLFQKVYVEVKTNTNPYVLDDIRKIINAQVRLHFDSCVFISVNSNLDNLRQLLRNVRNSETIRLDQLRIDWSRVFLFHSIIINGQINITEPISFNNL